MRNTVYTLARKGHIAFIGFLILALFGMQTAVNAQCTSMSVSSKDFCALVPAALGGAGIAEGVILDVDLDATTGLFNLTSNRIFNAGIGASSSCVFNLYDAAGLYIGSAFGSTTPVIYNCTDAMSYYIGVFPLPPPPLPNDWGCDDPPWVGGGIPPPSPISYPTFYYVTTSATLGGTESSPAALWVTTIDDDTPPLITCPADLTVEVNCLAPTDGIDYLGDGAAPFAISGLAFNPINAFDNCGVDFGSSSWRVIGPGGCGVSGPFGGIDPTGFQVFDFGVNYLEYTILDNSTPPNATVCTTTVTVVMEEPIAVCEIGFESILPGHPPSYPGSILTLPAITFDAGSYDGCTPIAITGDPGGLGGGPWPGGAITDWDPALATGFYIFEVTRTPLIPSSWTTSVSFDCSDVNTTVMVYFRVVRFPGGPIPAAAPWPPSCGEHLTIISDVCSTPVTIRDQSVPWLTCPSDITIDCHDPVSATLDPVHTGIPVVDDNCDNWTLLPPVDINISGPFSSPNCRTWLRTWTVVDNNILSGVNTSTCTQTITIEDKYAPYWLDVHPPEVWINEISYLGDNDNLAFPPDNGEEFVELAGTAGFDLNGWSLVIYEHQTEPALPSWPDNPDNVWKTILLDGWIPNEINGFGAVSFDLDPGFPDGPPFSFDDIPNDPYPLVGPPPPGPTLQWGGIALVNPAGQTMHFWSYNGPGGGPAGGPTGTLVFDADNGPAVGLTSTALGGGVFDPGPVIGLSGWSMALTDTGFGVRGDSSRVALGGSSPHAAWFNWEGGTAFVPATPGVLNNIGPFSQTFPDWFNPISWDTIQCGEDLPTFVPKAGDNCDNIVSIVALPETDTKGTGFACSYYEYEITRVFEATDNCARTSTASYIVHVIDSLAPVFTSIHPDVNIIKTGDNANTLPVRDFDTYETTDVIDIFPSTGNCDPDVILNPIFEDCAILGHMDINYDLLKWNGASFDYISTTAYTGNPIVLINLDQGVTYKVVLIAEDACGNISQLDVLVRTNLSTPVAVCDEELIALDGDGCVTLPAVFWDQGSHDECFCPIGSCTLITSGIPGPGELLVEIRHVGGTYGGTLSFDCDDIGTTFPLEYRVTNELGQSNVCDVSAEIMAGVSGYAVDCVETPASSQVTADGSLTATPLSGASSFNFMWSNGVNDNLVSSSTITGLLPGTYTVTVTDNDCGCVEVISCTVTVANAILINGGSNAGLNGATVAVPYTVNNFNNVGGFTLTVNMDNPAIGDFTSIVFNPLIGPGIAPPPILGPGVDMFTLVFSNPGGVTLGPGDLLFTVNVTLSPNPALIGMSSTISVAPANFVSALPPFNTLAWGNPVLGSVTITGGLPTITGQITTAGPNSNGVANVQVDNSLGGSQITTGPGGGYSFTVPLASAPTLDPFEILDADWAWNTGWDIGDPFLIKSYLANQWPPALGAGPSPCQFIAMDVNFNNVPDIGDALIIERVLAMIATPFAPPQESWRFVYINDCSLLPVNPLIGGFLEVAAMGPVLGPVTGVNFEAVKIGDVNFTTDALVTISSLTSSPKITKARNETPLRMVATEAVIKSGDTYELDIRSDESTMLGGFQFTLDYDAAMIELLDVTSTNLAGFDMNNFGHNAQDGQMAVVWTTGTPVNLGDDETIFTVKFKALNNLQALENVVKVNSTFTQAIAIAGQTGANYQPIDFSFVEPQLLDNEFVLNPNRPNPFTDETVISFILPQETSGNITVYTLDGKMVKSIEGTFLKGYNEVMLKASDLPAGGVYFYQLDTDTHSATRKMIMVE